MREKHVTKNTKQKAIIVENGFIIRHFQVPGTGGINFETIRITRITNIRNFPEFNSNHELRITPKNDPVDKILHRFCIRIRWNCVRIRITDQNNF